MKLKSDHCIAQQPCNGAAQGPYAYMYTEIHDEEFKERLMFPMSDLIEHIAYVDTYLWPEFENSLNIV